MPNLVRALLTCDRTCTRVDGPEPSREPERSVVGLQQVQEIKRPRSLGVGASESGAVGEDANEGYTSSSDSRRAARRSCGVIGAGAVAAMGIPPAPPRRGEASRRRIDAAAGGGPGALVFWLGETRRS